MTFGSEHDDGKALAKERWAIYIDVEGFSAIHRQYEVRAMQTLMSLMEGVYLLASKLYGKGDDRLFIHQTGDGFVIVSDFPENTLSRPVAIAIGLLQYLLAHGGVGRAGIAEGGFADVKGQLPAQIREALCGHHVELPAGIMTIFPVMGDALINAVKTQENSHKGPCLFVDPSLLASLEFDSLQFTTRSEDLVVIDWINSAPPALPDVREALSMSHIRRI